MQCHAAYSSAFSAHFLFSFHPFAQRGSSKVAALLTWAAKCILHSAFCRCKILAWALPGAQTTTQLDLRQDDSERRGKSWKSSLSSQNFGACCPPFFFVPPSLVCQSRAAKKTAARHKFSLSIGQLERQRGSRRVNTCTVREICNQKILKKKFKRQQKMERMS